MKKSKQSYVYAGLTILFWGTAASAFKLTLAHLSVYQMLAWASLSSTLALLVIIVITNKWGELKTLTWKKVAPAFALGLLNPLAYYLILFKAYDLLPAQVAQPLNFIWPLVLVLLAVPMLGEHITTKGVLALLVSFVGVILISSQGDLLGFEVASPWGVVLALFSAVLWAYYWIKNQQGNNLDPTVRLFLGFAFATVVIFAFSFFSKGFWSVNLYGIGGAIYIGLFEMGITFYVWQKALSLAESKAKLSNTIYLVPFLSLIFIHFVVGESIYWTTIVGLTIIVASIMYQQLNSKIKKN